MIDRDDWGLMVDCAKPRELATGSFLDTSLPSKYEIEQDAPGRWVIFASCAFGRRRLRECFPSEAAAQEAATDHLRRLIEAKGYAASHA